MILPDELLELAEQASTSVGQDLPDSASWTEWDTVLGPKHESVLLDYGGSYGYVNSIMHIKDRCGVTWQVVEDYSNGAKYGEYVFYEFSDDTLTTRRHGPMRYSHFVRLFGKDR